MTRLVLNVFLWALILSSKVYAQFEDDFSNGNFTTHPVWSGDTDRFIVNNDLQLQLKAPPQQDRSYLYTSSSVIDNTEWRFWIRMDFRPSNNNQARVYLVSDSPNLIEPLNGYFIRLGEDGAKDAIELYRQSGTAEVLVIRGTNAHVEDHIHNLRVKVIRDESGNWSLYADTLGGTNFHLQTSGFDDEHNEAKYFGIQCRYTSTRSQSFFFDDFYAGDFIFDTIAPEIDTLIVLDARRLELRFTKVIDPEIAIVLSNYSVDHNVANAVHADLQLDLKTLILTFEEVFTPRVQSRLLIENVSDPLGNTMKTIELTFVYYEPEWHDIVISEIMPNPIPSAGLPEREFVELYNRTEFYIPIKGWTFSNDSRAAVFPDIIMEPGSYLIVCPNTAVPLFETYGKVCGLSNWLGLKIRSDELTIRDQNGYVIFNLPYSDQWYKNSAKAEGGWSLEMIDLNNPCGRAENWRASKDPKGGTPGKINSVDAYNPDISLPELKKVWTQDSLTIVLFFSEPVDSIKAVDVNLYNIDNGISKPLEVLPLGPEFNSVKLVLPEVLVQGKIYSVTVNDIFDCAGNKMQEKILRFGLPEKAEKMDVVINEVLFNPYTGGNAFVELYNRSKKVIDLKEYRLSNRNDSAELTNIREITEEGSLLLPGSYVILTREIDLIKCCYYVPADADIIEMPSFISTPNSAGTVVFLHRDGSIIDIFSYKEDMHFDLIKEPKGVSLERVHYDYPSGDLNNWHSASTSVGYATPGYKNSQFREHGIGSDPFVIEPKIFSTDKRGFKEFTEIQYTFEEPGKTGTIIIFDAQGREVRRLAENVIFGTQGAYKWDGLDQNARKVLTGVYIVYIQVFDLKGNVEIYKKVLVVG